jgi:hypothetical protein
VRIPDVSTIPDQADLAEPTVEQIDLQELPTVHREETCKFTSNFFRSACAMSLLCEMQYNCTAQRDCQEGAAGQQLCGVQLWVSVTRTPLSLVSRNQFEHRGL